MVHRSGAAVTLDSSSLASMVREHTESNQRVFKAGYEAGYKQGLTEGLAEAKIALAEAEKIVKAVSLVFTS